MIQIFNSLGQMVKVADLSLKPQEVSQTPEGEANNFKLDVSDLPNGVYFLLLRSNNVNTVSKRIIISR